MSSVKLNVSAVSIAMALAALTGCSSGSSAVQNPKAPPAPMALPNILVIQGTAASGKSVLQFEATSPADATPVASLTLPSPMNILSVATDTSGLIYVGATTSTGSEVLVYQVGENNKFTAVRTIVSGPHSFTYPYLMTLDASGTLYVSDKTDCECVFVFSVTATGQATPDRTIQGDLTQIDDPVAIAVDSAGDIYVANHFGKYPNVPAPQGAQVEIFAPNAAGDVAPAHVITGTETDPLTPILGMAVDEASNVYVDFGPKIVEYVASSTGTFTPNKTIALLAMEAQSSTLRFDVNGNLFVLYQAASPGIAVYPKSATGFQPPEVPYDTGAWVSTPEYGQFALR